ncbi:MAG: gluconokinase [Bacteroidota bacterium]
MKDQVLVIVMGVSGTGKSSVGSVLASEKGWAFLEADDFHSREAKARMASGKPLDDEMRAPWIDRICAVLEQHRMNGSSVVLSCSALRAAHRDRFRATDYPICQFIFLNAHKEVIARRMAARENHFMPASLLDSQFDTLEWPTDETDIAEISVAQSLEEVIKEAIKQLRTQSTSTSRTS